MTVPTKTKKSEQDDLLDEADNSAEESFDLSDIEEAQIGALAPGEYLCEVVDVKRDVIKSGDNAGTPKLAIRFKPIEPASNKPVFKHAPLKGKGAPFTKGLLRSLGVDVTKPITVSEILGAKVYLTLSVRADRPTDNDIAATRAYAGAAEADEELV